MCLASLELVDPLQGDFLRRGHAAVQVVARREVLAVGPQHDDPHLVVVGGPGPRRVELVEQPHRLGIGLLRAVQRDDRDLIAYLVQDLIVH
jgi:hypothetical protein